MYSLEEITGALKQTREGKGLSQRALSKKAGLTQKHISKIENAEVDLRLSNLLKLARALELEVMLVPRKAVPAAQGLVRTVEATEQPPADPNKSIRQFDRAVENIRSIAPDLKEVRRLQELAKTFPRFRLTTEQYKTIHNATRELQRISHALPKTRATLDWHDEAARLAMVTGQLQQMRNAIVHAPPIPNLDVAKPAYQLDDDGDTDG